MLCQKLRTYMETGRVVFLNIRSIRPNRTQPRTEFHEDALTELASSIRHHGILQPLSVRRMETGYELIAGERRLRAAQIAGLTEIPCIIMNMDEKESGMAAMVENLQRQDLDFIEEANGIANLMEQWQFNQEQVAHILGKSQSSIANKLRLLRHSPAVLAALRQHGLTERHARALLQLGSEESKLEVIGQIVEQHLTVARTEALIEQMLCGHPPFPSKPSVRLFLNHLTQALAKIQHSGIAAISERKETDTQIILTITIPKSR